MNYTEARAYLKEVDERLGSDYSLIEVANLAERMGRPDRKTKMIHIAGTNGKGSVGNFLCQVLALSGYRVGRFTSPSVLRYRECIQKISAPKGEVVKEDISEKEVAASLTLLRKHCDAMVSAGYKQPTSFEIETIMAFQKFADWDVDVAVVESGLGGRLDATNIIEHPLQCVFTSISMEHQRILGDSLEKIAREKYGIIVKGTKVISPKSDACIDILEEICKKKGASLHFVEEESLEVEAYTLEGSRFRYRGNPYQVGQIGTFQVENAVLALESLRQLSEEFPRISEETISQGLRTSKWPGRLDMVCENPCVLIDGAHNPSAVERLVESLKIYFPQEQFDFIFGVFNDKDYRQEVELLLPLMHRAYTVTAPGKRGLPGETLEECILQYGEKQGMQVSVESCGSMEMACQKALDELDTGRKLVVCGSLSILGDAYRYLSDR